MKRLITLAALAVALVYSAVAVAAGSPTVTNGAATNVTNTSATVSGTVNPNGSATTYTFQYGTTTAYGQQTPPTSAGSSSAAQPVSQNLTNLTPGTTYHYRIVASNASGASASTDKTFTTTGTAPAPKTPPTATTGPATATRNGATLTGSVNPNGTATTYYFQYGQERNGTGFFELQTAPKSLAGGTTAQSVSATLSGLQANATYRYRLVATSANGTTVGAERTFKTGSARKKPSISLAVTPTTAKKLPQRFTASGKLKRPSGVSASAGCKGRVLVTFRPDKKVKKIFAAKRVKVTKACTYSWTTTVRAKYKGRLKVTARFVGNARLSPASRTTKVTIG